MTLDEQLARLDRTIDERMEQLDRALGDNYALTQRCKLLRNALDALVEAAETEGYLHSEQCACDWCEAAVAAQRALKETA